MVTQADVNLALSQLLNPRFRGSHPKAHEVITKLWNAHRAAQAVQPVALPRLTEAMMRAACKAHYGTDNIDGTALTAFDYDWSFRDAFKRMWKGVRSAMPATPPASAGPAAVKALEEVERTYWIEGKSAEWRAAKMKSIAAEALSTLAQQAPEPQGEAVSAIVPSHCTSTSFVFSEGVLCIKKDGSGYIAIDEEDFSLEDDRCEGPDGPEGSVHWITRLAASEIQALRDFLNGAPIATPPASAGPATVSVAWKPSMDDVFAGYVDWSNKPHNAKWVKKIEGTPIANDICVCIFERLKASAPGVTEAISFALATLVKIRDACDRDRVNSSLNTISAFGVDASIIKLQDVLSPAPEKP